jgi:hypothetical protein
MLITPIISIIKYISDTQLWNGQAMRTTLHTSNLFHTMPKYWHISAFIGKVCKINVSCHLLTAETNYSRISVFKNLCVFQTFALWLVPVKKDQTTLLVSQHSHSPGTLQITLSSVKLLSFIKWGWLFPCFMKWVCPSVTECILYFQKLFIIY